MKGVIDRIEKGIATILVEEKGLEFNVDIEELSAGVEQGVWLDLEVENGELISTKVDIGETESKKEEIDRKTERLRDQSGDGSKHERVG